MPLDKVISGGQTGADEAGLVIAKRFGIQTGGMMPRGFKTLSGPRPDMAETFGVKEHASTDYVARTYMNVYHSDGTVRFAGNFKSRGEICTLKAIEKYDKPHFDVDLTDPRPVSDFVAWLKAANISTLNVAGNAEQTFAGAFRTTYNYLTDAFFELGLNMQISDLEIMQLLSLDHRDKLAYTKDGQPVTLLVVRKVGRKS
jgi:hypothetical protein